MFLRIQSVVHHAKSHHLYVLYVNQVLNWKQEEHAFVIQCSQYVNIVKIMLTFVLIVILVLEILMVYAIVCQPKLLNVKDVL